MRLQAGLFSDITNLTHGFFTRQGGVSDGIYASLNCGPGSQDDPDKVAQNRLRVCNELGADPDKLFSLYQIHSPNVVVLESDNLPQDRPQADALVTNVPNIVLGILTADCTPVLFVEPESGIIGAAHAGWGGAVTGVLENTLDEMEKLGASRHLIRAAIGPTIAQEFYEVGPEFPDKIPDADRSLFMGSKNPGHFMFDLPGYVTQKLQAAGIDLIENLKQDTYSQEDKFFSYRRACHRFEKDYARQISCIGIF